MQIDAHTVGVGPCIHTIPPEILARIFSFVIDPPFEVFNNTRGPWVLARVCGRWRAVILETPLLWSSFTTQWGPIYGKQKLPLYVEAVETVLRRSKQTKLSTEFNSVWMPQSLEPFKGHISRLCELSVRCDLAELRLLDRLGQFHSLKRLDLSIGPLYNIGGSGTAGSSVYFDIATQAPRLVNLKLIVTSHLPSAESLMLPWPQLTHLYIDFSETDALQDSIRLHFVQQCVRLTHLRDVTYAHESDDDGEQEEDSQEAATLSSLESVQIVSFRSLAHLTCPAVHTLGVEGGFDITSRDAQIFREFMARSGCTIRNGFFAPGPAICQISPPTVVLIQQLCTITHLQTDSTHLDTLRDHTVFTLLKYEQTRPLFPAMQSLTLIVRDFRPLISEGDFQAGLIETIESRCNPPSNSTATRLSSFRIRPQVSYVSTDWGPATLLTTELYRKLREFEKAGLKVEIDYLGGHFGSE
ncbi:hypothetical protein BDZ89DRAFT_1157437 [Hymenopellis radicata]|nr:hypothetical protein BDZ89DRAFT_1157437 [Hymenopellis radicata]